ncbi:Hypothetical protein A7982_07043 [Minicystis rosea]|nr:Hypothetical protein A7982_07043 [Minicystis rosea]
MDYRDEREALRGRVENLEQELGDAKRELDAQRNDDRKARIAQVEKQMADAQRLLQQLGQELGELKGAPKPRSSTPVLLTITLVMIGSMVSGFLFFVRSAPPPPRIPENVPLEPVEPVAKQAAPSKPAPPQPTASTRRVHAAWTGKVTKSTGSGPAPGTPCTIEATLRNPKGAVDAADLTVACGGKMLYRSTDPLEGMSMNGSQGEEQAGTNPGTFVYSLAYDDKGTRSGARNEVSLDTKAGVGAVWRTSVPAFHVEFSVTAQSAPVTGEPLAR